MVAWGRRARVAGACGGAALIAGLAIAGGCGLSSEGQCTDACAGGDGGVEVAGNDDGHPDVQGDARGNEAGDAIVTDTGRDVVEEPVLVDGGDGATCDPSKDPTIETCLVSDQFGIFVAPMGNDANAGTMGSPFATIGHAVMVAATASYKIIFVCQGNYPGELLISASGIGIYGGYTCMGGAWMHNGNPAVLKMGVPSHVVGVSGVSSLTLEDLELDAVKGTIPGEASAGLFATGSTLVLRRVTVVGADGVDGAPGMPGTGVAGNAMNGQGATGSGGGPAQACVCGGNQSVGGKGGDPNMAGSPGLPALGGGAPGMAGKNDGNPGNNSTDAPGGMGAATAGSLQPSGWLPSSGTDGLSAQPAQGGGGGGGNSGGGGGGGACGGCGGGGGTGGGSGGSSFAVLTYNTSITLDSCTLSTGNGGNAGAGGAGAMGQGGGMGGMGMGPGSNSGGNGGGGGTGGGGGGGGGGCGGATIGVGWHLGTVMRVNTTITLGMPGMGGMGGMGNNGGGGGMSGPAMDMATLP